MNPIALPRCLRLAPFAAACLGFALFAPHAAADDPSPFPPELDTATIVEGAKLPKLIRRVEPMSPAESATLSAEQRVFVAFVVDAQGKVCHAAALFGAPPAFARAAVEAVQQWEFEPGLHSAGAGRRIVPVNTQMTVLLHFLPARAK